GFFKKHLAERMRNSALDLSFNQQRVDQWTAIIHRHVFDKFDFATFAIDLDSNDVSSEGIRAVGWFKETRRFEAGFKVLRQIFGDVSFGCQLGPRERVPRFSARGELAIPKENVLRLRLEQ